MRPSTAARHDNRPHHPLHQCGHLHCRPPLGRLSWLGARHAQGPWTISHGVAIHLGQAGYAPPTTTSSKLVNATAPLIWTERGQSPRRWWLAKVHNRSVYEIIELSIGGIHTGELFSIFHWVPDKRPLPDDYPTLRAAQAAAQADWEAFVQAALCS